MGKTASSPYQLREYQRDAVQATIEHFSSSLAPAVIVLPTGAGKSLVIAELAAIAKGRVLVLTHVKELVEQNASKFAAYGLEAGIYSAGLRQKQTQKKVTFASIQSVAANLEHFYQDYSLVVIDECHRINDADDSQYQKLLQQLRQKNPKIKILGLTATPFRLAKGWIYRQHHWGFFRPDKQQFFKRCIYELPLSYMIKHAYLCPFEQVDIATQRYDFSALSSSDNGEYPLKALNDLLGKYPRVTQAIVEDIEQQAQKRLGVMIFAATVEHAYEIAGYLPAQQTAVITGETAIQERSELIEAFKQQKIKFLVNVSVLTTGFDAPHVDLIAILRPTASVSLFVQMVGRGLRLAPGKENCLILDYANNNFNLFQPEVGEQRPNNDAELVQVFCPSCGFANSFWGIKSTDGQVIEHFGRRCQGSVANDETKIGVGQAGLPEQQCDYRFKFKLCSHCGAENDIAARVCQACQSVLIDPDDLLKKALSLKDKVVMRCAGMHFEASNGQLKIYYHDEDGMELSELYDMTGNKPQAKHFQQDFAPYLKQELLAIDETLRFDDLDFLLQAQQLFTAPDFIIAKKRKHYYQIEEKIFHYQGNYRQAYQLH